MADVFVGKVNEFADDVRKVVQVGDTEVGVFQTGGRFYAFANYCAHQGGPVCEGKVLGKVEAVLASDRTMLGERFSESEIHLVCPWHGWEYDISTGECVSDRTLRLQGYEVTVSGDDVFVRGK